MTVEEQAPEAVDDAAHRHAAPASPHLVRRTVLGGILGAAVGAAGYLVTADVLPGRTPLFKAVGLGGDDGELPRIPTGPVRVGSFVSAARGGVETNWVLALPPGTDAHTLAANPPLPVCVLLHGRGDSARSLVDVGYDRFLARAMLGGVPPFAIASVDGGDRYWHPRRAGDDTSRMVVEEFLPTLARAGLRAEPRDRIALLGYSMGGYGALLLGTHLGAGRVAAVVAESPALWTRFEDSHPGAFDDAADFRTNDVFARRGGLAGIPIKIDCGLADPFYRTAKQYAGSLAPAPAGTFGRGDHDYGYWRSIGSDSLDFIGRALAGP